MDQQSQEPRMTVPVKPARALPPSFRTAIDRIDDVTTLKLLVHGAPKTQHISAVIGDLEGSESIARIGQLPMHGNLPAYELCVQ